MSVSQALHRPLSSAVTILLLGSGCEPAPAARVPVDSTPAAPQPANRFDPAAVRRGDTVVGLVLDSIDRARTPSDEWVGSARFAGVLTISGRTFRHPDGDDYPFPCFEADSASARRLPQWAGDERRPWFCFENADEARTRLGAGGPGHAATIRIDRFTIHRSLSDAVNSAHLLAVDALGAGATPPSGQCFRTGTSVLARKPGTVSPGPAGLTGWLRMDRPARADSGAARLVDSDGRALAAAWRRIGNDSILVVGFDDFVRVEMRLAATADSLAGSALARSDAAMERDSAGRQVPFRRRWMVVAHRASCDSVPVRVP